MAKVLMIIAPKNFRDEELFRTKEELEKDGHIIVIASTTKKEAVGMLGGKANPEIKIDDVNIEDYSAIVFVGGSGAAIYLKDKKIQKIAKQAYEKGKVVAAICIAPSILANAGILKDKMATCWPSEETNLLAKGAYYTGESVTIDKNIVTASGPAAARYFGEAIAQLLKK